MKRIVISAALAVLMLASALLIPGCSRERVRERVTLYDAAPWEDIRRVLPITMDSSGDSYGLYADINAAARGKYLGRFRSTKMEPLYEGQRLDMYDGCRMFSFLDEPSEYSFLIDNGGQYLLARKILKDGEKGPELTDVTKLASMGLQNSCIYFNGRLFCTVLAVPASAAGEYCRALGPIDNGLSIRVADTELVPSLSKARSFGAHPIDECVIFASGESGLLFASVEYLKENNGMLISELEDLGLLEKAK